MDEPNDLALQFEKNRARLRAVAYRMLGSPAEADDAVQEAWLRLSRADADAVENLAGWLTTVVARVCLDLLRSRRSRREESLDEPPFEAGEGPFGQNDFERETLLADALGPALLVILETLAPAERLAFVLHDMFAVPFEEIAPIVGRSPTAARQLASRARRRVQGGASAPDADRARRREVVAAFLTASRDGNFDALLAVLSPEVVLRADDAAIALGSKPEVRGAQAVARTFSGRARDARHALINGVAGAAWVSGGRPRVAFEFTIENGTIVAIDLRADPHHLGQADLVIFEG